MALHLRFPIPANTASGSLFHCFPVGEPEFLSPEDMNVENGGLRMMAIRSDHFEYWYLSQLT